MRTFLTRMTGAAFLDAAVYEEVEADRSATVQAACVVALSSLAAGVGAMGPSVSWAALAANALLAFVLWCVWAILTVQIGTRFFATARTDADTGQLLRTLGFATAPGVLRVAGVVPGARGFVFAATAIWMLLAMIVAVRQALDYTSTVRAFAVCLSGWLLAVGMAVLISIFYFPALQ